MFSETDRERKTLYDLSYMWNLNNKANKREKKKTHRYREWVVAKVKWNRGVRVKQLKRIKRYKFPDIK